MAFTLRNECYEAEKWRLEQILQGKYPTEHSTICQFCIQLRTEGEIIAEILDDKVYHHRMLMDSLVPGYIESPLGYVVGWENTVFQAQVLIVMQHSPFPAEIPGREIIYAEFLANGMTAVAYLRYVADEHQFQPL